MFYNKIFEWQFVPLGKMCDTPLSHRVSHVLWKEVALKKIMSEYHNLDLNGI